MVRQEYIQQHAQYLARRYIPIQPCEVCGSDNHIHRHHSDYKKPLDVMFLCSKHHKQWHNNNKAQNYTKIETAPVSEVPEVPRNNLKLRTIYKRQLKKISQEDIEYLQSR